MVEHTFHGNHPDYDKFVTLRIDELFKTYGNNSQVFLSKVKDELIVDLKSEIVNAELLIKTNEAWLGKNLNDYFFKLLNPSP